MGGHIVSGHVDDVGVIEEISWGEKWGTLVIEFDEYVTENTNLDNLNLSTIMSTKKENFLFRYKVLYTSRFHIILNECS